MKQVQRLVTLALALFLIGLPAVTMAQSSPASPKAPAAQDKPTSPALDKPAPPSASPSTTSPSGRSVGSPSATPMSAADCQNNGWQKFGLKSEAECTAKVKK